MQVTGVGDVARAEDHCRTLNDGQRLAYRFTVLPVDPALDRPEGTVEQTTCVADAVTTAHLPDDMITAVQRRPTRSGPATR